VQSIQLGAARTQALTSSLQRPLRTPNVPSRKAEPQLAQMEARSCKMHGQAAWCSWTSQVLVRIGRRGAMMELINSLLLSTCASLKMCAVKAPRRMYFCSRSCDEHPGVQPGCVRARGYCSSCILLSWDETRIIIQVTEWSS
jgi:hypothetical protein